MPEINGDTRYGHRSGSGANEPKRQEKQRELEEQGEAILRPEAERADLGRLR